MKQLLKIILMLVLISSCAQEYDISNDNLDNTITIGGNNLVIPIGETDSIYLTDYIDMEEVEMLKTDSDGNFYIEFSQNVSNKVSMSDIIDNLSICRLESHFTKSFPLSLPDTVESNQNVSMTFPFDSILKLNYSFEKAKEYGLVKLDSLIIKSGDVKFNISMDIDGIENFRQPILVDLNFSYPKRYSMYVDGKPAEAVESGDNNDVILHGSVNSQGKVNLPSLEIHKIEFDISEDQSFDFTDYFYIKDLTVHIPDLSYITGTTADFDVKTFIASENDKLIHFKSFYGLVDHREASILQSISFDSIPDFMKDKDVVLDFYNPYLKFEINTNLGVPTKADIALEPKFKSSYNNENVIKFTLNAPVSNNPNKFDSKNYWLSSRKPSNLEGYEWKNTDINSLIKRFPDFLDIIVDTYTDISKGNHFIDFDADYLINGLFSFIVPFSFGSELNFPMSTTINDVPSILTDILSSTNVTLGGELVSMFPVDVKINFIFLDEAGRKLDVDVTPQVIKSIEQEGIPVKMPLNIAVASSKLNSDITSIVMEVTLLPGSKAGIPISKNAFLWAKLNVGVPNGITIDIDDLTDDNDKTK